MGNVAWDTDNERLLESRIIYSMKLLTFKTYLCDAKI